MIPRCAIPLLAIGVLATAPAALWAQAPANVPAPPEVEQALRARVSEFFQYHVDRGPALRRAIDLVAEDTKDDYYVAGKMEITKFRITDVKFEDGLQKADVTLDVTRPALFGTFAEEVTLPMYTKWKVEEDKWVWYRDKSSVTLTPMGTSDLEAAKNAPQLPGAQGLNLAELGDPKKLAQAAAAIVGKSGLDRSQVSFTLDQAGEDAVVYSNNFYGSVILELLDTTDLGPVSVSIEKRTLGAQEQSKILIRYAPPAKDPNAPAPEAGEQPAVPAAKTIRLAVHPFNQELAINVRFERAQ